ncbi:MAG: extracellular solute-binding protein [Chloroflexi bacterium]|nr:extracellular solute-binding protein [Chloroflexota bacterium]
MKLALISVIIFMLVSLAAACTQPGSPSPPPEIEPVEEKIISKVAWEQKWESTLAEAKKEGIVRVYTLWPPEATVPLSRVFAEKYGIELEFANLGKGSALLPKVEAENRAGLYLADVFGFGATTLIATVKPAGLLGPVEHMLILPEVTDPKAWSGGQIPFVDKDRTVVGMLSVLQRFIGYNTDLVKEGELTTYKDLLKPQYKGKITMADPSLTGTANAMFTHLVYDLWNPEEAAAFLKQLVQQQEAVIYSDNRMGPEWLARGKYAVGVAPLAAAIAEFLNLSAPVSLAVQKEGHLIDVAGGALAVPRIIPHPKATTVFVNWLLTKEAQAIFAVKGYGQPSLRQDVATEGINPLFLPKPGEKLFFLTEEAIMSRGELLGVAKRIVEGR